MMAAAYRPQLDPPLDTLDQIFGAWTAEFDGCGLFRRQQGVHSPNRLTEESVVIELTEPAISKVKELIEQEGNAELALRVAVRPGGCSGFAYEMFFDSDLAADDLTSSFPNGVRVVVDPSSAQLLQGATLDYADGLQASGFAITNPNAERTCGCGQSFS